MNRKLIFVGFAVLLVVAVGGRIRPAVVGRLYTVYFPVRSGSQPLRASLVPAAATVNTSGFARADGPRPLRFSEDHGPHESYQTEWWYYTGNLVADSGEQFGYQLTFFRRALVPPAERSARTSAWGTDQVYLAHFALTDVGGPSPQHHAFERLSRGAAGLAGGQATLFRVWLDDWSVSADGAAGAIEDGAPMALRAGADGIAIDLILRSLRPAVLNGDGGYSRKGPEPGNASIYYSLTRIATAGAVVVGGRSYAVHGLSWMDHEFSTSALGLDAVGWDWFSLQLVTPGAGKPSTGRRGQGQGGDAGELMAFQLRKADGSVDPFSAGTLVKPDGTSRTLGSGDFSVEVTDHWRSPNTGALYPSGWVLTVPSARARLVVTPKLADQEMAVSFTYWEGAVDVSGTLNGIEVAGSGYVELTGYAGSMQGQF